jgi:hypothetical protein
MLRFFIKPETVIVFPSAYKGKSVLTERGGIDVVTGV